jgi:hypothetical protein
MQIVDHQVRVDRRSSIRLITETCSKANYVARRGSIRVSAAIGQTVSG